MRLNPCVAIGLFGDIIITIIALYWAVIKTSPHKRNHRDSSSSMPNPQRAHGPEDDRTGRKSGRVGENWEKKKFSL